MMLQRFLRICKNPIIECDGSASLATSDNIVRRVYRKQTEGGMKFQIDALILPEGMIWPTFLAVKQRRSFFKNIYFQRQTAADVNRRIISLDLLRKNYEAIWVGSPGIGKSCDINYIFIELLHHLGEDGWPSMVAFRSESILFTFTASNVTYTPICFSELLNYSQIHEDDNSVLILELLESENDPILSMPFILAVSPIDLASKFKTLGKSGFDEFMLISPPDVEEVCLMTEAMMDICPENKIFKGNTKEEAISIVRTRALKIGAIPRYLFCSERNFITRLTLMKVSATSKLSSDFQTLSVNNIPDAAKCFVAPYFRPGVTDPRLHVSYVKAAPD